MSSQGGDTPIGRRRFLQGAGAIAVVGSGALAACGGTVSTPGTGSSTASGSTAAITVTDQRGTKLSLPGPAERIVTLPMPAAALLIAVDQGPAHLAGMHEASWVAIRDGIMGEMFPEALEIAHDVADQEFAPNVESVVALDPDVVVQWGQLGDEVIAPLENAGLQVAGLTYGGQEDLATWMTFFAAILGKPERGEALNARMEADLEQIRSVVSEQEGKRPRVLYFNQFADSLKVAAADTYNDFYIDLVGATNVASDPAEGAAGSGMVAVDTEQVLAWDPEIILLGNFDGAMPQDVYGGEVWAGLSAVRTKQVYKVPLGGYRWDPPSQESPLMWRWLSQLAFPQDRSTLAADIVDYFDFLYGRTPTATQIETMLWSEANASSAHYEQFHAS